MRRYASSECATRWENLWIWAMIGFMAIVTPLLIVSAVKAEERSPDSWFALLVSIAEDVTTADAEHRKLANINREDRRFILKMMNELTVSQEAKPTPAQGQWLLAIREWLDAEKKKR